MEKIVSNIRGFKIVTNPSALQELDENNCTFPNVDRVIYNIGKKAYPQRDVNGKILKDNDGKILYTPEVPVLATVVYFVDGTKVSVINSQHDGVEFEDYTLSDGKTVKIATKESKERGLIYAVMKRLVSIPDATGKMTDGGLSRILNTIVDGAYDTVIEESELKIARAKSKLEHEAAVAAAKARGPKPKYSIAGTLERFNKLLDKLEADPAASKDLLDKVTSIFKN